ncbi:hypothetical protein [Hydrogenimonas sp.]
MSKKIVCKSCGSTDVSIELPWYRCNYCGTRHLLFTEYTLFLAFREGLKRRYLTILIVTILLVILTAGLVYLYLFEYRQSETVKPKTNDFHQVSGSFPNMVFSTRFLKNISLFKRTPTGDYIVVGQEPYGDSRLLLFNRDGKLLWHSNLGANRSSDTVVGLDGSVIVTGYNYHDGGLLVCLENNGDIRYRKEVHYNALAPSERGIIGVKGGRIEARDNSGELIWQRIVDGRKVTKRAGGRLNETTGKTEPFYKTFDRLDLEYLIRLRSGKYVALGKVDSDVAIVQFDTGGKILGYDRYDFGRVYIDAVTPTRDGGFAMVARRGIQFFKFNERGVLEQRSRLNKGRRHAYNYSLVETGDGYLISSSIGEESKILILHIDAAGQKLGQHTYAKKGVRLHPEFLVEGPDGNYLLAVTTEIYEPWIARVLADGTLDADLENPIRHAGEKYIQSPIVSPKKIGDIFPESTPIVLSRKVKPVIKMIETQRILGGSIRKIILSKERDLFYAITGATGFNIYRFKSDGKVTRLSRILRTRSKLVITPHRISTTEGKPPVRGSVYDYDRPWDFAVNRYETRAYVADAVHGFYIVDISDKNNPKVLSVVRGLKLHSFVLSPDEKSIYFYARRALRNLEIDEIMNNPDITEEDGDGRIRIAVLEGGNKFVVSEKNYLRLYDSTGEFLLQHKIRAGNFIRSLKTDGQDIVYLEAGLKIIEVFHIGEDNLFHSLTQIDNENIINDMQLFPEEKKLCMADQKGVLCSDYHDPLNPVPVIRYRNKALYSANFLIYDSLRRRLVVAFEPTAIGSVDFQP